MVAVADLALIPGALALFVALKEVNKSWMLLATAIILTYVAIDISTFVSTALGLVALTHEAQSAAVVSAEQFGLSTISLSQFFGWVFPPLGFLILAVVIRRGRFGRGTALLGFLTVIFSILGGIGFLHPVPSWQKYQLPGLFLLGLFSLALGRMLLKLNRTSSEARR